MVKVPENLTTDSNRDTGKAAKSTLGQFSMSCVSTPIDIWSENSKSISALCKLFQSVYVSMALKITVRQSLP
jgi:hypothetical protein